MGDIARKLAMDHVHFNAQALSRVKTRPRDRINLELRLLPEANCNERAASARAIVIGRCAL
jgi:hypothetical protein